ncbi:MAG: hypothetical protein IJB59_02200 [Oscillospiraceae bacterium]|nr:hypothetical protein [Oscillospiraceae bacterium]
MKGSGWILILYMLPCAFAAMYLDAAYGVAAGYPVMLVYMMILGYLCRRGNCIRFGVLGNALSLVVSLALLGFFQKDWQIVFKPFSIWGMAVMLSAVWFMIQYLIWYWNRERNTVQNFFVALFSSTLGVGAVVLVFLIVQAKQFGAI